MIGAACVLRPSAALAEADVAAFRQLADDASRRCAGRVVLDASSIPYVDSAGLEALLDVTEALGKAGRSLKICCANATIRQILRITGIAGSFELYDEVNAGV